MQGGAGDGDGMGDSAAGRHGGSVARTAKPPKAVAGSRRQAFTCLSAYGASRMRGICAFVALLVITPSHAALSAEQPYRIAHHRRRGTDAYVDGQGPFDFLIDTPSRR